MIRKINRNSPVLSRFWSRVNKRGKQTPLGRCWEWVASIGTHGYGQLSVNGKPVTTHTFSWKIHNGEIEGSKFVLHRCNNKSCVNPRHLYLGTHGDNVRDRTADGGDPQGERNGMSRLTKTQILEAKRKYIPYHRTRGIRALARELGVNHSYLGEVIRGRRWKHLAGVKL
jgi:hypothetical protein